MRETALRALVNWAGVGLLAVLLCSLSVAWAQESATLLDAYKAGNTLYGQGRVAEALPFWEEALELGKFEYGPDHETTAVLHGNLAELYRALRRYDLAERHFTRSLEIHEQTKAKDDPAIARSLYNLADLYRLQGRFSEAEPTFDRALLIAERALDPDDPMIATLLNNLAEMYRAQGRFGEAEPRYVRALAILERSLGRDHVSVAQILNNIGGLYEALGRLADAEPFYLRSIAIKESVLESNHPSQATSYNNLAGLYQAQGRYEEALPLLEKSLAIREDSLGREHLLVAQSLSNLGAANRLLGQFDTAERLIKRSLDIREDSLGPDHIDVAQSLNNLARLYQAEGKPEQAEPLYRRALQIKEAALAWDHPSLASSLYNLGTLNADLGRNEAAEVLLVRALVIRERSLGPEHPYVAESLAALAQTYNALGRESDAAPLRERAQRMARAILDSEPEEIAQSQFDLAALSPDVTRAGPDTVASASLDDAIAIPTPPTPQETIDAPTGTATPAVPTTEVEVATLDVPDGGSFFDTADGANLSSPEDATVTADNDEGTTGGTTGADFGVDTSDDSRIVADVLPPYAEVLIASLTPAAAPPEAMESPVASAGLPPWLTEVTGSSAAVDEKRFAPPDSVVASVVAAEPEISAPPIPAQAREFAAVDSAGETDAIAPQAPADALVPRQVWPAAPSTPEPTVAEAPLPLAPSFDGGRPPRTEVAALERQGSIAQIDAPPAAIKIDRGGPQAEPSAPLGTLAPLSAPPSPPLERIAIISDTADPSKIRAPSAAGTSSLQLAADDRPAPTQREPTTVAAAMPDIATVHPPSPTVDLMGDEPAAPRATSLAKLDPMQAPDAQDSTPLLPPDPSATAPDPVPGLSVASPDPDRTRVAAATPASDSQAPVAPNWPSPASVAEADDAASVETGLSAIIPDLSDLLAENSAILSDTPRPREIWNSSLAPRWSMSKKEGPSDLVEAVMRVAKAVPASPQAVPAPSAIGGDSLDRVLAGGKYVVQVASLLTEERARIGLQELENTLADLLEGRALEINVADLGDQGLHYRIGVGGFNDATKARDYCARLSDAGHECWVMNR